MCVCVYKFAAIHWIKNIFPLRINIDIHFLCFKSRSFEFLPMIFCIFSVVTPRESQCRYDNHYPLPPPSGYISSEALPSATGTHVPCSWRLSASPGQQINLTLYDFSVWQYGQGTGSSRGRTVCRRYAIISEGDGIRESPICGGTTRVKNIFISEGNMVDIRLMNTDDPEERAYFLIKYES